MKISHTRFKQCQEFGQLTCLTYLQVKIILVPMPQDYGNDSEISHVSTNSALSGLQ